MRTPVLTHSKVGSGGFIVVHSGFVPFNSFDPQVFNYSIVLMKSLKRSISVLPIRHTGALLSFPHTLPIYSC